MSKQVRRFPCGKYGKQRLEFFAAPYRSPLRAFAALVFCWRGDKVVLCNIGDRGWCIPSGRVEPFESSIDAARREAAEEAGAQLDTMLYLGCYRISEKSEVRWADVFVGEVKDLGDIQCPEESFGRMLVEPNKLSEVYYSWNDLTEMLFDYSYEVLQRSRSIGA